MKTSVQNPTDMHLELPWAEDLFDDVLEYSLRFQVGCDGKVNLLTSYNALSLQWGKENSKPDLAGYCELETYIKN